MQRPTQIFRQTRILWAAVCSLPLFVVMYAHHGWAEFDQSKEVTLTGIVAEPTFEYPHTTMKLRVDDVIWDIQMAPPRRLNRMGVSNDNLQEGKEVTVVGHPHRSITHMMRIFEITIDGETFSVR